MKYKIMFVDDDPLVLKMASIYLKHIADRIVFATSGEQCLEVLSEDHDFNLIILDIMMPGIDGIAALKAIRNTREISDIKILMQTGMLNVDQDLITSLNASIIFKPYSKKDLLETLEIMFQA